MQEQIRDSIANFIGQTCEHLDKEAFSDFLAHCDDDFNYRVTTFSPDLGMDMTWLEHDRKGFESMINMLPEHVRVDAEFSRHATLSSIARLDSSKVQARTKLAVFQTDKNGTSTILCVGTYIDILNVAEPEKPKLQSRELRLATRDLGPGVHVPI